MPRRTYEKYALASGLAQFLYNSGWTSITEVKRGFQDDVPVIVPAVSLHYSPSRFDELQMGRDKPDFYRRVQVDAYMEDEARAESIGDDIADFFDLESVDVLDPDLNTIARIHCYDTSSITMETLRPNFTDTEVKRWREVVKATVYVDYLNDS